MRKSGLRFLLVFIIFLFSVQSVWASYMLPYPSYLPGHRLYSLSRFYDRVMSYWYFGKIASVRYHLQLADKYLVESRTLFEYGQYLLALDALDRSDREFSKSLAVYLEAVSEGRDLAAVTGKLEGATDTHIRVILELVSRLPEEAVWSPEKANSQILALHERLSESQQIREQAVIR
jgi:hypothetical protein